MQDESKMMNNGRLWLSFIVFELLFVVICATAVSRIFVSDRISLNNYSEQPYIKIENIEAMGLPAEQIDDIQRVLINIVNNNTIEINLKEDVGKIREEAKVSHYFDGQDLNYFSAIVDIPNLKQSYQLFYEYSDDSSNKYLSENDRIVFLCVTDKQYIIYPDFDCKDIYSQKTRNAIVAKYIKYFNFGDYLVSVDNNYSQVKITALGDNVENNEKEAITKNVKEKIRSLLISPDLFEYL